METTYDEILYDTLPQVQGNLRTLETVADLFQVEPVDIRRCRVLELGCGTGKTLLPQAEEFPDSEFLGIDLSRQQIDDGNRFIEELGLKNIRLLCADIMDVSPNWGSFDYIIVHGIFSWVPPAVQVKILDICRENLSADGVAMISFNTYPGWHYKEAVRNLMTFHVREANRFDVGDAELRAARQILDDFTTLKSQQNGHDAPTFVHLQKKMRTYEDGYVFHEFLEKENHPYYFVDFQRRLNTRELDHLSDVDWKYFGVCMQQKDFRKLVEPVSRQRDLEQYLDFFVNRPFRAGVVCRETKAAGAVMRQDIAGRYALRMPEAVQIERTDAATWTFRLSDENSVSVGFRLTVSPFHDAIVEFLSAWRPEYFTLQEITVAALADAPTFNWEELNSMLSTLARLGLLKIALRPAESGRSSTDRPCVRGFSRLLAARGMTSIPNPDFECLRLDPVQQTLVSLLDGSRTVPEVAEAARQSVESVDRFVELLRRLQYLT